MYIVIAFAVAAALWSALCIALDLLASRWHSWALRRLMTHYVLGLAFYAKRPWYVRLHQRLHRRQLLTGISTYAVSLGPYKPGDEYHGVHRVDPVEVVRR